MQVFSSTFAPDDQGLEIKLKYPNYEFFFSAKQFLFFFLSRLFERDPSPRRGKSSGYTWPNPLDRESGEKLFSRPPHRVKFTGKNTQIIILCRRCLFVIGSVDRMIFLFSSSSSSSSVCTFPSDFCDVGYYRFRKVKEFCSFVKERHRKKLRPKRALMRTLSWITSIRVVFDTKK